MNPRRLVRNSFFMTGGVVAGGLVLFAIFVLIARYLPVQRFGQFVFVLTLASLFQLFADGGIVNVTIRELAREPDHRARRYGSTRTLVWLVSLALLAAIGAGSALWDAEPPVRAAAWWMGLAALLGLHGLLATAVLRAAEDMGTVALAGLAHKLVLMALVWVAIRLDGGIEGVAAAHAAANLLHWLAMALLVRWRYLRAPWCVDPAHWWTVVQACVPLGAGQVLRRLSTHLGIFLLTALAGVAAVGVYSSAHRVIQMIELGATATTSALFPVFSRLARQDPASLQRLYRDSLRLMIVLAAPVAGVLMVFGEQISLALYGPAYAEAGASMRLLGAALVFLVPGAVMHAMFAAIDRQTLFMKLAGLGILCNATLGLALIPRLGALGAACASLATEVMLFAAGALYLRSQGGYTADYLAVFGRVLLALAVAVAAAVLALRGVAGAPGVLLAGALLLLGYAAAVMAARVVTPAELAFMRDAARPRREPAA